ncbi:MAG: hypothetical protein HY718_12900 [Planctomycetes bacterium]|nr:hypothetical protein [Planctomycetota bacterium]
MRPSRWQWIVAAAVIAACGCSKLTYENWQTIQVGSASQDLVKATLGEPWKTVDGTWVYNDPDRHITAMVKFSDDKVIGKEWADAERGMETVGEQPDQPGESERLRIQEIR